MTISKPRLSIILLNYGNSKWLEKCLHSFHNLEHWTVNGPEDIEVIVVDNGSKPSPLAELSQKFPWIKTIQNEKNLGFAGGNNVGIKQATAPFVMLLNSDTEFKQNTDLLALLEKFSDEKLAVVTPRLELTNGQLDPACHRGFPTPWNALMYYSGVAKLFPQAKWAAGYHLSWLDLKKAHEIEACSGAAMIVRQAAIAEVGVLDEDFFMYAEDIDWCYRFAQAGWKTLYDPEVTIIHHKYKSGQQTANWETKSKTISAFYDTMKQFMDKHYRRKYPRVILFLSFVMIDVLKKWKMHYERKQYASK